MFSGNLLQFLAMSFMMINRQEDEMSDRYSFLMEWYDADASLIRRYYLYYFPVDDTVELYDLKNKRTFLRRMQLNEIRLRDLHEGASVHVLGRLMTVVQYANDYTRKRLAVAQQKTVAIVKPDGMRKLSEIVKNVYSQGFTISKLKMLGMSAHGAGSLYGEHKDKHFYQPLVQYVTSGPVVAMELVADGAVTKWRALLGPTDSEKARKEAPNTLRARYGTDVTQNALHGSESSEAAAREAALFFPDCRGGCGGPPAAAAFCNSTCCIVKPHLVKRGLLGDVLEAIDNGGFRLTAAQMFYMEQANAEEFYEVYKGVVPEYKAMVTQLVSGPCVALEVSGSGSDTAARFRELVGPSDPELARQLRPGSLRARFGEDRVRNGVHCSDLPEDAPLEVEYFFKLLQ